MVAMVEITCCVIHTVSWIVCVRMLSEKSLSFIDLLIHRCPQVQLGYRHPKGTTEEYVIQYQDSVIARAAYYSLISP
jgi:hypothetical protein